MRWTIANARRHFSKLVRDAAREPQQILNRNEPVATLVDAKAFAEFKAWKAQQSAGTIADSFAELRQILVDEGIALDFGERRDRPNAFVDVRDEISRDETAPR